MLAPRLSAAAAELPELRARLAELQAAAKTRDIVIDGASNAIAAANLQSRPEELAKSVGVTIGSTEGIAAENRGGYRRVGLRLAISGDPATLVVWLLLHLFGVRSRISFERLHEAVGLIIVGGWIGTLFVIGPIVAMISGGGVLLGFWHSPN
jgi:hypothetical protein